MRDYIILKPHNATGRLYLRACDGWNMSVGELIGAARGYATEREAFDAAQHHAVCTDVCSATVLRERDNGDVGQIGHVGTMYHEYLP